MGKVHRTSISWCTHAVNPILAIDRATEKRCWACTKIAQGCANCYAERLNRRLGTGHGFDAKGEAAVEWVLDDDAIASVLRMRGPATIFWCDMTDLFHERVPDAWLDRCFAAMALTPNLRHIVLTKRAARMREYLCSEDPDRYTSVDETASELSGEAGVGVVTRWPLANVALGVSVATQRDADELVPELLATPAALRFVSYEPALEAVDMEQWMHDSTCARDEEIPFCICSEPREGSLDLIIIGGESGPGARPFDLAWARDTIAQCEAADVVPMLKQLGRRVLGAGKPYGLSRWLLEGDGEWVPPIIGAHERPANAIGWVSGDMHGGDPWAWPDDLSPYACSPERWPWGAGT